jgi:hypothetical protein
MVFAANQFNNSEIRGYYSGFFPSEFGHRILQFALYIRAREDVLKSIPSTSDQYRDAQIRLGSGYPLTPCGSLWEDSNASEQPLSLREACNKIIHAETWEFYPRAKRTLSPGYAPLLSLAGRRGHQQWRADLDIIRFLALVEGYIW